MSDPSTLPPPEEQSSLKLDPKLAGSLCYLFGCLSGLLFFLLETESRRIRFHALQSILVFTALTLLSIISAVLSILTNFIPFQLTSSVIWLIHFIVWLYLIIKTYQGVTVKIPGIGDFAQEQVGWPS